MIPPKQLVQAIHENHAFIITTHRSPDPDAVGSAIILAWLLKALNKDVKIIMHDTPPKITGFFSFINEIIIKDSLENESFDVLCVTDCGSIERTGLFDNEAHFPEKIINIDHHISNDNFGKWNWVEPEVSACTIPLFHLAEHMGIKITREIGEIIYASLLTETGSFNYSNTDKHCFQVALFVLSCGVKPDKVANYIYNSSPIGRIELTGEVLKRIDISKDGKISWLLVKTSDYETTQTKPEDVDGLVNYALSIKGVEVGLLFKEVEKNSLFKVSLRSSGKVNVSDVAQNFKGGGHKQAAGCFIKGTYEEALRKLQDQIYQTCSNLK